MEEAGGFIDSRMRLAGDFDLWSRFFKLDELYGVTSPIAGFRDHGDQKTGQEGAAYVQEALEVLLRHGGRPSQSSVHSDPESSKKITYGTETEVRLRLFGPNMRFQQFHRLDNREVCPLIQLGDFPFIERCTFTRQECRLDLLLGEECPHTNRYKFSFA